MLPHVLRLLVHSGNGECGSVVRALPRSHPPTPALERHPLRGANRLRTGRIEVVFRAQVIGLRKALGTEHRKIGTSTAFR